jgi:hypothetical protein
LGAKTIEEHPERGMERLEVRATAIGTPARTSLRAET